MDRGHVIIVPTVARLNRAKNSGLIFVFISHQWLDFKTPDPENIHYDAMVNVVRAVAEDAMTSLDRIRVWVDYVSIPQENRFTQRAAISSLPTFASSCDYVRFRRPPRSFKVSVRGAYAVDAIYH